MVGTTQMTDDGSGGLAVYVPAEDSQLEKTVWPQSGMVGSEYGESGKVRVDFEGNQDIYPTYEIRVARAAERHLHARSSGERGYPTRSCAWVDREEVVEVGRWDPLAGELDITNPERLSDWLE